jgi:hypothetical protein
MFVSLPHSLDYVLQTELCPNMSHWVESFGILFDDESIELEGGAREK